MNRLTNKEYVIDIMLKTL